MKNLVESIGGRAKTTLWFSKFGLIYGYIPDYGLFRMELASPFFEETVRKKWEPYMNCNNISYNNDNAYFAIDFRFVRDRVLRGDDRNDIDGWGQDWREKLG